MKTCKNIRVYGIFIQNEELLVTDEIRFGKKMTKFPGGGMEQGEGTIEALIRECQEEMGLTPSNIKHFYTTDFFQETQMIDPPQQLISIYYTIDLEDINTLPLLDKPFDFEHKEGAQGFRFIYLREVHPDLFTFPIDKKIALLLSQNYKTKK
jgi:8-oxo-dGTP pyrophosphatase MutT (NUDIX family)